MGVAQRMSMYTTVTCQTISTQGDLYAASTESGDVCVARIEDIISGVGGEAMFSFFGMEKEPVFCLTSNQDFLFAGGRGQIRAWRWSDLLDQRNTQPAFVLPVGQYNARVRVNWLDCDQLSDGRDRLIAGCGDTNIYVYNLETLDLKSSLTGHTSFVHSVCAVQSAGISVLSGGEDGAVKLWDTRTSAQEVFSFSPHAEEMIRRPKHGNFISTVSCQGDWLVCGGGPVTSLWNLSTRIMSGAIPPETGVVYASKIVDDRIYTSGQNTHLCVSNYGGETISTEKLSTNCIYSLAHSAKHQLIAAAGSSPNIHFVQTTNHELLKTIKIKQASL